MYFISEVLSDSRTRYPQIQKLLYAVLIAKRKLHRYFKSHPVTVVTSFPLGEVIQNQDVSQMAIKSQVLADFIAEWTEVQMLPMVVDQEYWMIYFDGSLMKKGTGVGLVFVSPLGVRMRYMVHIHFPSSNNVAEYEALINGLRITIQLGIRCLDVRGDS